MGWKQERDLLIAQTLAFVQSVTGKKADASANAEADVRVEAASPFEAAPLDVTEIPALDITATEMLAAEIIAPAREIQPRNLQPDDIKPIQVSLKLPRAIVGDDIRTEIQARVANFRAHQERFHREREEYFSATLRNVRTALGSPATTGLLSPQHRLADPASRSAPAPAANAAKTPSDSHSSESGQGPS
jgi:hypothetical protein